MTTIAWDGTTLAGDTQALTSYKWEVDKVWQINKTTIFAGAGSYASIYEVMLWLCDPEDKDRPTLEEDFVGIVVRDGRAFRIQSNLVEFPIKENAHAIGSGAPFAITAMFLGKTAEEAVEIASQFDETTGGNITSIVAPVVSKIVGL